MLNWQVLKPHSRPEGKRIGTEKWAEKSGAKTNLLPRGANDALYKISPISFKKLIQTFIDDILN